MYRTTSRSASGSASTSRTRPLRVLKFGGTSVGDGSCIRQAAEIVRQATEHSDVVVVVSAMSGVTNQLIEAATQSEAGDLTSAAKIFAEIRERHEAAMNRLIHSPERRRNLMRKMQEICEEGERLCHGTQLLRELTLRARDSISSLGERLSAPLVAAALLESGVQSEAIEATEIVVTDCNHGAAEPCIQSTRERSQARLGALLKQGIVPVVTGFIGATPEGVLTTLGRGGSDYSATILAAALDADEVIIWTDVDGLMTADPRLVEGARTIAEISYREAAELAHFGAKVLHPKTLRAVTQCGIPLWIRNTFAPERAGTRITPSGPGHAGVKGLAAVRDLTSNPAVAIVTVVGNNLLHSGTAERTLAALSREQVGIVDVAQGSSDFNFSFVVAELAVTAALVALHREFQLGAEILSADDSSDDPQVGSAPYYDSERPIASGD